MPTRTDATMADIALRRLNLLAVPAGPGLRARHKHTLVAEYTALGYAVHNPDVLDHADPAFVDRHAGVIDALQKKRGGGAAYVPLFADFPTIPDDDAYFARRLFGYLGNAFGSFAQADAPGRTLENGMCVPDWLFELDQFGADPITQQQDRGLFEAAAAAQQQRADDGHVHWLPLTLATPDDVHTALVRWAQDAISSPSSLKAAVREDLFALLPHVHGSLALSDVPFKETRALLLAHFWTAGDHASVQALVHTPTDLLRGFAVLTGTDASLAGPIQFPRLSKAQRRLVLACLENTPALLEDLGRYRGLWLAVARAVHPGTYSTRWPKAAAAFSALAVGKPPSFAGRTEALLRAGDHDSVLAHLQTRPGLFARRLHEVLRAFADHTDKTLAAFDAVSARVPLKTLLVLQSHFATINTRDTRAFVLKSGRLMGAENPHTGALTDTQLANVHTSLDRAVHAQLAARSSWTGRRVWLDPALRHIAVPLQQRSASDGLITLGRGSRVPVDRSRTLRLFIYWHDGGLTTDIDLSVALLDADFKLVGHVSYTNLKAGDIVHSGDIQSAPYGAAEFVDIPPGALPAGTTMHGRPVRYACMQVHRYEGQPFGAITCTAGWMLRDAPDAEQKSFDIKTVHNAFKVAVPGAYAVPMLLDLDTDEIILMDLAARGDAHSRVEQTAGSGQFLCREVAAFTDTRPNMHTLLEQHVAARGGALVAERAQASHTYGLDDTCTTDVRRAEAVLAALL